MTAHIYLMLRKDRIHIQYYVSLVAHSASGRVVSTAQVRFSMWPEHSQASGCSNFIVEMLSLPCQWFFLGVFAYVRVIHPLSRTDRDLFSRPVKELSIACIFSYE